ncbi:MAG: hypothetical protein ACR2PL_23415 [Dehalococcoidia bacterium]
MELAALGNPPMLFVEGLRDWVVIIWGILSIILLVALTVVVVTLALSVKRLIAEVSDLINNGVRPVLASARESAENVTGTTRFIGDKVVTPLIRVVSVISGVRRGIAVFGGLTGRGKREEEKR